VSTRASALLAWSLAGLSLAMFVASITLWVLARSAQLPGDLEASVTPIDMLVSVPVLAFPVVGALIASKRSHNPIGWICLAEGILWAFLGMIESYGLYGLARPGSVPFPVAVYALGEWLWVPTVGLVAIYLPLLFPDGRLPSGRWRPLAWISGVTIRIVQESPSVRVLVVTLFEDEDSVFMALRAGARGYVLKDAEEEEMEHAIRAVGKGEAIFSPAIAERVLAYFTGPKPSVPP
jgi:hypothetical protein